MIRDEIQLRLAGLPIHDRSSHLLLTAQQGKQFLIVAGFLGLPNFLEHHLIFTLPCFPPQRIHRASPGVERRFRSLTRQQELVEECAVLPWPPRFVHIDRRPLDGAHETLLNEVLRVGGASRQAIVIPPEKIAVVTIDLLIILRSTAHGQNLK